MKEHEVYCRSCQRIIVAENKKEVELGLHDSYLFVHDDVDHTFEDWLRTVCFKEPTKEAYDLAKSAWEESKK